MARLLTSLLLALVAHPSRTAANPGGPSTVPPSQLITSPLSCLTSVECAPDRYCKEPPMDDFFLFEETRLPEISTCEPRLPEGSDCNFFLSECEQGTFCGFLDDISSTSRCLRQAPLGAACAPTVSSPCQGELVCQFERICRPFDFGFEGDTCQYDQHCQQGRGFFCRHNFNQCARKKPPGGTCELEANNFECDGFCVSSFDGIGGTPGICQRVQKAGEKCNRDRQCQTRPFLFGRARFADLLCNRPTGYTGVCVLETDLIRELGASCNPANDMCDARRGLSCSSELKCVQQGNGLSSSQDFCTPGSPLSSCPPDADGNPRECRRALDAINEFTGTYSCRTRRQVVPLGNPCNHREFADCAPGAVCAEAPGVAPPFGRFPPPPLYTCMEVVPVGSRCPDQFRFKCEEGSFCVDGICKRVDAPPTAPVTFASFEGDCSKLSCPPGTECRSEVDSPQSPKSCKLPVLEVGLSEPCFYSAQFDFRCKDNLQCSRDLMGQGERECRPKRGIGGICVGDDSCVEGLQCDISRLEPSQRRCFDPSLSLNIGDACNPNPHPEDPRCVAVVQRDPSLQYILNSFPLSCLPKNGSNVCQRAVGLFRQCSAEGNIACESNDLVCSNLNVCVPKSQA